LTTARVRSEVDVSQQGTSDVVAVRATDPDPTRARLIANTFAREFIAFRADADRTKLLAAKRLADRQFSLLSPEEQLRARGQALSTAAEKLGVLASLQTGNAELVQPASLPGSPSYPRTLRNALIGGLLGLVFGVLLAFMVERIARPLRDADEAQEAFGLPVVGTIPNSQMIASASEWLPFADVESFQTLRGALHYFNHDRSLHSVVVTSSAASEGKSTVAWNLAVVAASSTKTVLIEADLRKPTLAVTHSLFPTPGLSDLLTKQVQLQDALQTLVIEADADSLHGGGQSLDILVAGSAPPNPAQLLEGGAMELLLAELTHTYDLVVIDTPPVGLVADAFPILNQVDGVLAVCRVGETTQDAAAHLRQQLERLGAPLLGVVVNGLRQSRKGRRYGYGYYERHTHGTTMRATAPRPSRMEDPPASPEAAEFEKGAVL
jgi:capsular exopolysaccharide synthesis family protein